MAEGKSPLPLEEDRTAFRGSLRALNALGGNKLLMLRDDANPGIPPPPRRSPWK